MFIRDLVKPDLWQDLLPVGQIVSYKNHCRNGLPSNARIVSFHDRGGGGKNRPHQVKASWLREHWV